MTEINFGSTYRIPVSQKGINSEAKAKLKALIDTYPNRIVGTGNTGFARVSIPNSDDEMFLAKLKDFGYKIFKMFKGENIQKKDLDEYIRQGLAFKEYKDFGKEKPAVISKIKSKKFDYSVDAHHENLVPESTQIKVRQSRGYIETVEKFGKEFADAVYFYTKKK